MRQAGLRYLLGGAFHTLAWTEWGPEQGAPVVCVHGLTRNGRDFDALAMALAEAGRRVLCVDLPGRGASDWLAVPQLYTPPSYVVALAHLLARIDGPVDWVGTSLGGICGMMVAAGRGHPIRRLVLNDIGARVPAEAASRIAAYVQQQPRFVDLSAFEAHLRQVHAPFGALTDDAWRHMAETSHRVLEHEPPGGRIAPHYDPAIALPFRDSATGPVDLAFIWSLVAVPTLLIRGGDSDVLEAEVAAEMAMRPGVLLHTLPGIGHAPALQDPAQIRLVQDFLAA